MASPHCGRLPARISQHVESMSLIRPHAARKDLRRGGFVPPLGYQERRRQRTALSLVAGLALAISTVIAVTIVSIGLAQAGL
jgi:hypothetical protein